MTDAWHELQRAMRVLRKVGDIRRRLIAAYRTLFEIREKDLPNEVRHHYEWLISSIGRHSSERRYAEIRDAIAAMTPAQRIEAAHRIAALHDALQGYQPAVVPTRQKQAACRVLLEQERRDDHESLDCVNCTQCKRF